MGTVKGALGAPGRASAATGRRTCIRSFRASPDQVGEARRFLAQVLGDCPTAPDAVACLSELATNSVLYSNSRRPKGRFIVRAYLRPAGLRVEVEDEGGPWKHRQGRNDQRGRGLAIVHALSTDWSISGEGTSRTVWFEIGEDGPPVSKTL
jgi:anti-sigma regulatory factor (Ser/Thr protein kinase)